jgi:Zn-dependent peptidase ImmA (M78 family)
MSELAFKVEPTSRKKLRKLAESFWDVTNPAIEMYPIVEVVDVALSKHLGDRYTFAVVDKDLMEDSHGLTDPDRQIMLIRADVYDGACRGNGRDRFTLAHELGHLWLHGGGRYLQRAAPDAGPPTHRKFEDSEWQANQFAAELLMPIKLVVKCSSAEDLAKRAGVSVQAAEIRFKALREEGAIK